MNHLHPTIKFTFQQFSQQISFLDMTVLIRADRKLSTTLYRKPTYCAAPISTTHSIVKKVLFCHRLLDTTSLLQMTTYYKKNLIPSQYLSLPENTHWTSSPTTSPKPFFSPMTPFSMKPPRHQVLWQSSQLSPYIL